MGWNADIIGSLYDAALDPEYWPTALERICRELRAKAAIIHVFNPGARDAETVSLAYGTDPRQSKLLYADYASHPPIRSLLSRERVDEAGTILDELGEAEFLNTRLYKEWFAPQGYHDMVSALFSRTTDRIGVFSVLRGPCERRFSPDEVAIIPRLTPHIRRAVPSTQLFASTKLELLASPVIIDQLATAVVIFDASARLLRANPAAKVLIAEGQIISVKAGRFYLQCPDGWQSLKKLIEPDMKAPAIIRLARGEKRRLLAAVLPLSSNGITAFALLVHCPVENSAAVAAELTRVFSFTPREAVVAMHLLSGRSLEDIASDLGVRHATAKSHLNALFEKTRTSRQADLVQCVLRALPPIFLK